LPTGLQNAQPPIASASRRTERSGRPANEVKVGLQRLPSWALQNGKLHREYKFGEFSDAFGFMVSFALEQGQGATR
jgi:hypothetical protein